MTDAPLTPEQEDVALAAEYVLRLLDPEEERAVQERMTTDPSFAGLVNGWLAEFTIMSDEVEGVAPDRSLRASLLKRAFPDTVQQSTLWERLGLWRWGAVIAVIAGLAVFLVLPSTPIAPPDYFAEIVSEDGSLTVEASYFRETQDILVEVTAGSAPEGRVLQLWGIAERQAPVPIGVILADGTTRLDAPDALKGKWAGLICAVSEEPPGGSPTGLPTGQILATAELRQL